MQLFKKAGSPAGNSGASDFMPRSLAKPDIGKTMKSLDAAAKRDAAEARRQERERKEREANACCFCGC